MALFGALSSTCPMTGLRINVGRIVSTKSKRSVEIGELAHARNMFDVPFLCQRVFKSFFVLTVP